MTIFRTGARWRTSRRSESLRQVNFFFLFLSVPARHISEGAAPCPYCLAPCPNSLAPCPIYMAPCPKKIKLSRIIVIAVFVFSDSRRTVNCLQICAHVFIDRPQNCAPDPVSFACWIVPEFWSFARQIVPNFCCNLPFSQPSWNAVSNAVPPSCPIRLPTHDYIRRMLKVYYDLN